MVKIGLQFKAFLENVTGLLAEGEDFRLVAVGIYTQFEDKHWFDSFIQIY